MAEIKGMFRVNKNNALTLNIQYAVCFMQDKLLLVKIGGEFADGGKAVAGAAIGGVIGGVIGAVIDQKNTIADAQKELILQRLRGFSSEELLKLDKHNFQINYDTVSHISIRESTYNLLYMKPRSGLITSELSNQRSLKFDISARDKLDDCRDIINQIFPDKLVNF
jgi:hypothetical protein